MKKVFYGWLIVAFGATVFAVNAFPIYGFGIFLTPLTTKFGWQRGAISGAASLGMLINGLLSILAGRLSDRYGPRLLVTAAGIALGAGLILMSRISSLWQVYLIWGVSVGIGLSGTVIPISTTIPRWFISRRGLALSIPAAGFGLGAVVTPLIIQQLISTVDWRMSFVIIGIIPLVITIPLAQFMRHSPQQMGLTPYESSRIPEATTITIHKTSGFSFNQAIRSKPFWILGVVNFGFGVCLQTITIHIVPHAIDTGLMPTAAAVLLSIIAISSVPSKFSSGLISDRIGSIQSLCLSMTLITLSLTLLIFVETTPMFYLFALLFGISYGIAIPLWTIVAADLFGVESLGTISGTLFFLNVLGGAVGGPLSGWIFDSTGSYTIAFITTASVGAVSVLLNLHLLRFKPRISTLA